jgi:hypothetical protein
MGRLPTPSPLTKALVIYPSQVAAIESILRKPLGLIALRCPVLHRVHEESGITQRIDHMRTMFLEI